MRVQERESGFFADLEELLTRLVPQDERERERLLPVSSPPWPGSMTITGLYMEAARMAGDTAGFGMGGCRSEAPSAEAPASGAGRLASAFTARPVSMAPRPRRDR